MHKTIFCNQSVPKDNRYERKENQKKIHKKNKDRKKIQVTSMFKLD